MSDFWKPYSEWAGGQIGHWYRKGDEACQRGEAPPDANTHFEVGCDKCVIVMKMVIRTEPPPGAFRGWWEQRETMIEALREKGIEL